MNDQPITPTEAEALLDAYKRARIDAVAKAIAAILQEHRCELVAVPQVIDGRIVAYMQVVAK